MQFIRCSAKYLQSDQSQSLHSSYSWGARQCQHQRSLRISQAKYEDRIDLCIESRVCKHPSHLFHPPSPSSSSPNLVFTFLSSLEKYTDKFECFHVNIFQRTSVLAESNLTLMTKTGADTTSQSFFPSPNSFQFLHLSSALNLAWLWLPLNITS